MVQGGDPAGNSTGNAGYQIRERPPSDLVYTERSVAMAKAGDEPAGTSGSQFFIVTAVESGLEPDYALRGRVTRGYQTVRRMELVPASGDMPLVTPVIKKITIKVK